jgi:hypothetical protein
VADLCTGHAAAGAQSDLIWVHRLVIAEVLPTAQNGGSGSQVSPDAAAERDWPGEEGRPSRLRGITGICIFSGQRSWAVG